MELKHYKFEAKLGISIYFCNLIHDFNARIYIYIIALKS